jgi:hypothetical protein
VRRREEGKTDDDGSVRLLRGGDGAGILGAGRASGAKTLSRWRRSTRGRMPSPRRRQETRTSSGFLMCNPRITIFADRLVVMKSFRRPPSFLHFFIQNEPPGSRLPSPAIAWSDPPGPKVTLPIICRVVSSHRRITQ